jgi:hypothetical protein
VYGWRSPKLLYRLNCESKGENNGRIRSWGMFPGSQHFKGRRACWSFRMWTKTNDKRVNYSHWTTQTKHNWSIFGARTSHGQTQTHKTHHGLNLGEATTFPLIIFSMPDHGAYTQMSFCPKTPKLGISKFPKLKFLQLWRPITFSANPGLSWGLK